MAEGLSTAQAMSEITLNELEGLRKETVESYLLYLQDSHLFERSLLLTKPTKSAKKNTVT
ncbi:hypothetical protein ACLMAB_08405 [Brevibacillus laterosporus]